MNKQFISIEQARKDGNNTVNQDIKSKFIGQHVYANVNSMVEYIIQKSYESNDTPFSYEDIENYYAHPEVQYTRNGEILYFDGSDAERDQLVAELEAEQEDNEDIDNSEAIEVLNNSSSEAQEVYEWWLVSDYLRRMLQEKGHVVLSDENIWGRGTTGQAILLDCVITEICANMEILQGQRNSWENHK